MYPHERSLVKKLADKPFVILGVNSDPDRDMLKQVMRDEQITWRSWWDGGDTSGPIATQWNVRGWPTLYLIDHTGKIRHKFMGFPGEERFDSALDALVKEAEQSAESAKPGDR
jgi:hypothetical protein